MFFSSEKRNITDTIVYSNSISDHNLIGINRKINCQRFASKTIKSRDYSRYDKEQFKANLRAIPWENCFVQDEFNRGWDLFKHYLISTIDKHVPLKEKQVRGIASPWLTREIRQLMNSRDFHLRKFNQTKLDTHWVQYKNLRNTVTKKIRTAKANHVRNVLRETAQPTFGNKSRSVTLPTRSAQAKLFASTVVLRQTRRPLSTSFVISSQEWGRV